MTIRTAVPAHANIRTNGDTAVVLGVVLVSYFLLVLNNSIIFTGLPQVQHDLGLSATGLSWVQNAFTLVFGGLLLLAARAGDLLDRGRLLVAGLVVFGAASLLVGFATQDWWIILARALQGVGAAIIAPTSLSLITSTFDAGPARTRAVAAYGLTAGIGASIGLVAGGAFAAIWSWRVGFHVSAVIAVVLVVVAVRVLPRGTSVRGKFDVLGAVASTVGMGGVVYGITAGAQYGWTSPITVGCICGGLAILAAFVLHQRHAVSPIMPLRLFANRQRSGAAVARMMFAGGIIAFFYFTVQFFQGVYGWNPLQAGLAFLPMTIVQFLFGLTIPRWTQRFGNSMLLLVGIALVLGGMVWLTRVSAGAPYMGAMAGPLVLIGAGQGLAFGPLTAAGVVQAQPRDAGAAAGLVNTAHQLGSTLGIAILASVTANAANLTEQTVDAYIGSSVMFAVSLAAIAFVILPGERAERARASAEPPERCQS